METRAKSKFVQIWNNVSFNQPCVTEYFRSKSSIKSSLFKCCIIGAGLILPPLALNTRLTWSCNWHSAHAPLTEWWPVIETTKILYNTRYEQHSSVKNICVISQWMFSSSANTVKTYTSSCVLQIKGSWLVEAYRWGIALRSWGNTYCPGLLDPALRHVHSSTSKPTPPY